MLPNHHHHQVSPHKDTAVPEKRREEGRKMEGKEGRDGETDRPTDRQTGKDCEREEGGGKGEIETARGKRKGDRDMEGWKEGAMMYSDIELWRLK